jgi:hypothetical protein
MCFAFILVRVKCAIKKATLDFNSCSWVHPRHLIGKRYPCINVDVLQLTSSIIDGGHVLSTELSITQRAKNLKN